ncbi:tyrosine-type recombinase/integrase [Paeniglutamicibacter gangotriensis]|uniref:Tyrosine-type recombinase/integrase n=1 Tax=Paeniglutamicibacter gangotriensis TaxID=254787 RepID=A0A5B0DTU5_9MICC|nr:tyrosine-type recombinase/integrase [Paeniglutamicibacter gangotriensis]KAA0969853.1 tyrosine-type recombinase/integrase [Paeniglutamicibacter gangotriensis]
MGYKRSLGYSISKTGDQNVLREIARFIADYPIDPDVVSRAMVDRLTARKPGEAVSTQCKRIAILRQFCLWVASKGYAPAIPDMGLVRDTSDFVPRIVTATEMARILAVADQSASEQRRLLLRLLWCCGIRIGEACALTVSDLDIGAGTILIRHAKGDRTRLLPMSQSLWEYVAGYLQRCEPAEADGASPLMPTARGNVPRGSHAGVALSKLFAHAGVLTRQGKPIRPHDLRHSYAVHALEKMVDDGTDIYAALPLLATYLGHADITSSSTTSDSPKTRCYASLTLNSRTQNGFLAGSHERISAPVAVLPH